MLQDVTLELRSGRVHALMGENGAGKSTLIKLIAGVVSPDAMTARKEGQQISIGSSADAARAGFRFIHQELNIVSVTVRSGKTSCLDMPSRTGWACWSIGTKWPAVRNLHSPNSALITSMLKFTPVPLALVTAMLIKLASALVSHPGEARPCLYVLDEPTAALNDSEVEKLFAVTRRLKAEGAAILYVSHRMSEIMQICDDVTVLRNGKKISTAAVSDTSRDGIILDMTGRDIGQAYPVRKADIGDTVLCRMEQVATRKLTGVDFTLHDGRNPRGSRPRRRRANRRPEPVSGW